MTKAHSYNSNHSGGERVGGSGEKREGIIKLALVTFIILSLFHFSGIYQNFSVIKKS